MKRNTVPFLKGKIQRRVEKERLYGKNRMNDQQFTGYGQIDFNPIIFLKRTAFGVRVFYVVSNANDSSNINPLNVNFIFADSTNSSFARIFRLF